MAGYGECAEDDFITFGGLNLTSDLTDTGLIPLLYWRGEWSPVSRDETETIRGVMVSEDVRETGMPIELAGDWLELLPYMTLAQIEEMVDEVRTLRIPLADGRVYAFTHAVLVSITAKAESRVTTHKEGVVIKFRSLQGWTVTWPSLVTP